MTGNAVSVTDQKKQALQGYLNQEFRSIQAVLPEVVDPKRFVNVALQAVVRQPELFECSPGSIVQSVLQSAQLGLEIGGPLQHAHLVKFGGDAQLIVGYKGMIYLAKRSGAINKAVVRAVYEGESFRAEFGSENKIYHTPRFDIDRSNDANITKVYVIFWLPDGEQQFEVIGREEVEKIRSVSKAKNGPGWTKWWGEMAKKSVVKRGLKMIPLTSEVAAAIEIDNRFETGEASAFLPGIDTDQAVAQQVDQATAARKARLKEELAEYAEKQKGGRDVTPDEGADAEDEDDEDKVTRLDLENELADLMKEKNPDLLKKKKVRGAWVSEILGDSEKTTVKGCSEFELQVLIGALKNDEDEPLPGTTPFDDDEEGAEAEDAPMPA